MALLGAMALFAAMLAGTQGAPTQGADPVEFTFNFEDGAQGWKVEFADLPVDYDDSIYELAHEHRPLPNGPEGNGIYVQGHNRSDDLFMYLKKQVDGLRPNVAYAVSISIDLATNVSEGLVGIGGSPGGSVFVKAGATTVEPEVVEDSNQYLRMNIDKGNQSRGGESMAVLGDIAHPEVIDREYWIKTLVNADKPLNVTADGEGRVWLIVGTDSGFEGLTGLYFARISYILTPVQGQDKDDSTPTPDSTAAPEPQPTATPVPEPTPTAAPAPASTPAATSAPELTRAAEPTPGPTATLPPEPAPAPTAKVVAEIERGPGSPTWLIAVLVVAGLSAAVGAAALIWRQRQPG